MHNHICPRCNKPYSHEAFAYERQWNALQRIAARSLHRFYGACNPCISKFIKADFFQDKEIEQLRVHAGTPEGMPTFSQSIKV